MAASRAVQARGQNVLDVTKDDFPLPRLGRKLAALLDDLEGGRGYVLVRGVPVEDIAVDDSALSCGASARISASPNRRIARAISCIMCATPDSRP